MTLVLENLLLAISATAWMAIVWDICFPPG